MRFEELDTKLRQYETAHDLCVLPDVYIVARLDGRGFTKKTKEIWDLDAPFDLRFHKAMVATTIHLMECGFHVVYGYTQSDEISLLFTLGEDTFKRKLRKINSVLAGEASGLFSLQMQSLASFDCRVCQLPNAKLVADYFCWRQEDAHRNSLNAHCYWMLRHQGKSAKIATQMMSGMPVKEKHELLFANGINFNDLPDWQKRGVGLYFEEVPRMGFNPITQQDVETQRREIKVDEHLPLGENYAEFVKRFT